LNPEVPGGISASRLLKNSKFGRTPSVAFKSLCLESALDKDSLQEIELSTSCVEKATMVYLALVFTPKAQQSDLIALLKHEIAGAKSQKTLEGLASGIGLAMNGGFFRSKNLIYTGEAEQPRRALLLLADTKQAELGSKPGEPGIVHEIVSVFVG
jgi:hypothetical protein